MAIRKKPQIDYYRAGVKAQFHIMGEKIRWNPYSGKNHHLPLCLKAAGYSAWGPKDGYKRKNSATTAIGIITHGGALISQNGKEYQASAGDIFLTHKEADLQVRTGEQKVLHKRFVIFDGSLVPSILHDFQLSEQVVISPKDPVKYVSVLRNLFHSLKNPKEEALITQATKLFQLLFMLQRECLHKINHPIHEMAKYLGENLHQNITLEHLCKKFSISKRSANRAFQAQLKCSPIQYHNRQRIEYASLLLRDSPQSIEQIAIKTGFNSSAHFSQYFKRITGSTPSDFRNNSQEPLAQVQR